jgi:DNA-binding NarL/FixJ family response regulator
MPSQDDLGPKSPALKRLSRRERQVLKFVVEGKSDAEIATLLQVAPKSVESYRRRMMEKLGIEDLPTLVKFAIRNGITPL